MRESADSFDIGAYGTGQYHAGYGGARHGKPGRGKRGQRFDDDEPVFAKRQAYRPHLPPEDANDATDGLREGDRWSTWDAISGDSATSGCHAGRPPVTALALNLLFNLSALIGGGLPVLRGASS